MAFRFWPRSPLSRPGAASKLFLIHTTETFSSLSLFGVADVRENMHQVMMSPLYWIAVGLYLVLTPLQEFVARCCLQAPLHAFLNGTPFRRHLWSILVSNLVFAAAHSHISFAFAIAAFIPGLFWGWIFARTNSLVAASASHFMIGGAGIFLFGIEEVVAKLMAAWACSAAAIDTTYAHTNRVFARNGAIQVVETLGLIAL